jgi:hypothetical protein
MTEFNNNIVAELSNTQRISLKSGEKSIIIQKDYRKNSEEDWTTSKGIEVPHKFVPKLIEQLKELLSMQ